MGPDEIHAAQDMGVGELGTGAGRLLVPHEVADVVHEGADQRRIDVIGIESLAGKFQSVQHACGTKHHLIGMAAVVVQGLELLVAGKFSVEGTVEQAEGAGNPAQVMAGGETVHDRANLRLDLLGVAGVADGCKGAVVSQESCFQNREKRTGSARDPIPAELSAAPPNRGRDPEDRWPEETGGTGTRRVSVQANAFISV